MGDFYYLILGISIVLLIYNTLIKGKDRLINKIFKIGAFISIFYFLFHVLWGLNYYRDSLFDTLKLEQKEYTLTEITNLTNDLLNKLKETQLMLVANDTLKVEIRESKNQIISNVTLGYNKLANDLPQYVYQYKSIKKSIFSSPLTYMGFSGYLNPFSGEAQVDYLVPKVNLPMICSHEVSHQLGIASESEANFIGYLAATRSSDPYYRYSSYLMALQYSVNAIYNRDSITYNKIVKSIPVGVIKNINESQEFWQSYQNIAEPFFKLFYDNYLKANQQQDGMKSYSKMVNLLVAYHSKHGIK
jgi:hypothetical protein